MKAVGSGLDDLVAILEDAQALEQRARDDLAQKRYVYDEANDKYTLDNGAELSDQFYEVYGRFSQWLTRYQL